MTLQERLHAYSLIYQKIKAGHMPVGCFSLPNGAAFIGNEDILLLPRDDGDSRYPYGENGFLFWAYGSGYLHGNEGLFSTFLHAGEGQEPNIAFFMAVPICAGTAKAGYQPISLLNVPYGLGEADRFTVFTPAAAYYITQREELSAILRVCADEDNQLVFSLLIANTATVSKDLLVSAYFNPFLRHSLFESAEDRWFRESHFLPQALGGADAFLVCANEDLNRTQSISNYAVIRRCSQLTQAKRHSTEATTSRIQYVGNTRASLHRPLSLEKGTFGVPCHCCAFIETACAAEISTITVDQGGMARFDWAVQSFENCADTSLAKHLLAQPLQLTSIDDAAARLEAREKTARKRFAFQCNEDGAQSIFEPFLECVKKQVAFCSYIKGYVQLAPNSLIGIRDVFQALEAVCWYAPEAARVKMLEALGFVLENGRCPRQYALPQHAHAMPRMDLREFIDQGNWVISTVVFYLKLTGDFAFLEEPCGYYTLLDEPSQTVQKSAVEDTVLEHLLRMMQYLDDNLDAKTGCMHALYGDWNDALDGLGVSKNRERAFGTGVSVMASLQFYQNLNEMSELLAFLGGEVNIEKAKKYDVKASELATALSKYAIVTNQQGQKRIVHGWGDEAAYYVGSFCDVDGASRVGLTSASFWVLSGMLARDPAMEATVLEAFSLLDSDYGLRTFEPPFEPTVKGVGRIPKLPAGTAENGASYLHATAFGAMALFKMGHAKEAWMQIKKIVPFTHQSVNVSPFVMPNSYGCNPEKNIKGESMADWQTGSSNVLFKLFVRYLIGIVPAYEGVWIAPSAWQPFSSFRCSVVLHGCTVLVCYHQTGAERVFTLDGVRVVPQWDFEIKAYKLFLSLGEIRQRKTLTVTISG